MYVVKLIQNKLSQ